ncbi:GntR family transcriptional regulator [Cellulomonas fimi]|uniref:GntR family transcriptional regulator n=1 Tax=Cellulomonas fimi TaxID=1708 RepID=UPI00234E0A13|nr:GntR family transcriptional regulator [Cellulomonas fimi]MDC7122266.1 GntR family transcriptional regulator [Cellulomonas fimi]
MPIPTTPIDVTGAAERAALYDRLLDAIVTGDLAPGQRLVEHELCERFGTTRAVLGEALARLSLVGLTDVVPRRSTHVTPVDPRRVREALGVLGEVTAAAIADGFPRLTDADRDALVAYRDTWLLDDGTALTALRESRVSDVQDVFFRRAANADLDRVRSWVSPGLVRFHRLHADAADAVASLRTQRALVDAALTGDAPAAVAAWRDAAAVVPTAIRGSATAPVHRAGTRLIRDRVLDAIRDAILDGTLVPGEQLRESDLMRWLGVSRTPVRDALAMLAEIGIVTQRYHQPARVATLDRREFVDAMRAAGVLRSYARRLCIERSPQALTDVLEAEIAALTRDDSASARIAAATRVVEATLEGARDTVLTEVLDRLAPRVNWYATHEPSVLDAFDAAALRDLRDAVRSGDVERAAAVDARFYDVAAEPPTAG